jgi:hypothetical protein
VSSGRAQRTPGGLHELIVPDLGLVTRREKQES